MESRFCRLAVAAVVVLVSIYGVQGQVKTTDGRNCVFPFTYNGASYTACTTVGNNNVLWCATTAVFVSGSGNWGNCAAITVARKTTTGKDCVFPFTYNSIVYTDCTPINNNGKPWCSTTNNYPKDRQFGDCAPPTTGGTKTTDGRDCVFPFIYKSVARSGCITDGNNNVLWCSTTANYDTDRKWGNCATAPEVIKTTDGGTCVFPFIYKGVAKTGCITDENGGVLWCSKTANYDTDKSWGNCVTGGSTTPATTTTTAPSTTCPYFTKYANTISTTGQVLQGAALNNLKLCWDGCMATSACVGFEFRKSTNRCYFHTNNGDFSSAVANNDYDQYRKTTVNCDTVRTEANVLCVFPFIYQGNYVTECTNAAAPAGKYWCATTGNYDTDKSKWGYCKARPTVDLYTKDGKKCANPFTYGGTTYTECTMAGGETKPWCALDTIYQTGRWGYCRTGVTPGACKTYNVYTDTRSSAANPIRITAATTRQACRENCDGDSNCVGFEFGGTAFNECYKHTNLANMMSQAGSNSVYDQFRQVKADCPACVPWEPRNGMDAPGGTLVASNYALMLCKDACARRSECIGIDFFTNTAAASVTDATTGICYWHNDATVVNRLAVNSNNIFYRRNVGCTGCIDYFTRVPSTDSRNSGNVIQTSVTNEVGCFSACLKEPGCTAFDTSLSSTNQFICDLTSDTNVRANAVFGNTAFTLFVREKCSDINTTPAPPTTIRASNGKNCVFPFTYNNVRYTACTMVGHNKLWCATASVYSSTEWGDCLDSPSTQTTTPTTSGTPTQGGTATTPSTVVLITENGDRCAVPFTYNGVTYTACTTVGANRAWCSLDTVHVAGRWGYCATQQGTTTPTTPTNQVYTEKGQLCRFPFNYNGQSYTACTLVGSAINKPWCGLVTNVDASNSAHWGHCASTNPNPTPITTTNGKTCVFPFTYNGQSYSTCITVNAAQPWCSATSVYDGVEWGYCIQASNCVRGFRVYPDKRSANQIYTPAGNTQIACNDLCLGQTTCFGYDWFVNNCYLHRNANDFSTSNTVTDSTSTQYRKETCGNDFGACINNRRFQQFAGMGSNGGAVQPTLVALADCLNGCRVDATCLGTDYNAPNPADDRCYFHRNNANFANTYTNANVNQYRKQNC